MIIHTSKSVCKSISKMVVQKAFFVLCLSTVLGVNSLHVQLEGPSWTRYHPCGLGIISFTKHDDPIWKAELNLKHYYNLTTSDDVEVIIRFKENTFFMPYSSHNNITFTVSDQHTIEITAGVLAQKSAILFDAKSEDSNVPIVSELIVNYDSICNDDMRASQAIVYSPPSEGTPAWRYQQECGRKWPDREEWLTVRSEADSGDWPWHVAIYRDNAYRCGGTIVSETAVVTADFCLAKTTAIEKMMVVAGINNLTDTSQSGRQQLNVTEIIRYPGHDTRPEKVNVLMIIKVNTFEFTKYVQPICLLSLPAFDPDIIVNEAIFVGYGKTRAHKMNDILRSTEMVITGSNCREKYSSFNEFNFCAAFKTLSDDKLTMGDGGSGLVMFSTEDDQRITWYLRGVWTRGYTYDNIEFDPKKSLLFIDVAPFYTWILHHSEL